MANNAPNLKVNVGADTSQFETGMKKAKKELQSFEKTTDGAMSSISGALGVPMDKIKGLGSALQGAATKMEQMGVKGTGALRSLGVAATGAGAAVAGIGIGVLVGQFKLLNEEAENFRSTWEGLEDAAAMKAWMETFKQGMHDANAEAGSDFAKLMDKVKKVWQMSWATAKKSFMDGAVVGIANMPSAGIGNAQLAFNKKAAADEAAAFARAWKAEEKRWIGEGPGAEGNEMKVTRLESKIAEYREVATTGTDASKLQNYAAALTAIDEKYALLKAHASAIAEIMRAMANLAGSTEEEMKAAAQAELAVEKINAQQATERRAVLRQQETVEKRIAEQRKAEAAAAAAAAAKEAEAWDKLQESLTTDLIASIEADVKLNDKELQEQVQADIKEAAENFKKIPVEVDVQPLTLMTFDMTNPISGLASDISASIGEMIANLTNGEDAFGNFGQSVVSAFGEFAVTIGKMVMQSGFAALSISKLISNPLVAIAAGAALITLGMATKTAVANAANGSSYSADSAVASSAYATSPAITGVERTLKIDVTGTLKADGSQLVAVLNNEANRRNHTT